MEMKQLKKAKSKMRPLTKSEKTLLTILGIALVIWTSNKFILTPQAEKISSLEAEKLDLDTKIEEMNNTLKREDNIKKEWAVLHRERNEVLAHYFPTLDQAQIIYLLNDLLAKDGITVSDLNFSQPSIEKIGELEVKQMGIALPFNGNYDGIVEAVKSIETSPRRIIVDTLSMDRSSNADLGGNMSLKVYSLDGLVETDTEVIYVDVADGPGEGSLFGAFDGYTDPNGATEGSAGGSPGTGVAAPGGPTEIDESDYTKVYMLADFENRNYSFVPSNDMIKGNVSPSTIRKSGKYSLRFEYDMLALDEKDNKAYIDLTGYNLELKHPADAISMWVNAFGYSPGTLGMIFRTQGGDDIPIVVTEGISWLGWSNLEAAPPQDLSQYPLKLTHLYFELPYNRDDFGVFLIDKLEAFYPISEDKAANDANANFFYKVEAGETVTSISRKVYGTTGYKNEIMKNNGITPGEVLTVGRVLVLVRR
ncbi:LysM peptidoglycan-binding domain-containing protein [Tissierella creatinini]|nr:LysM peptidoglycan-binding domain-containing protein [Tissierella creatinini]TJX69076.1 LysM peptidoglycan-binding domain-containing protein [Soehngenia saccharolytica]